MSNILVIDDEAGIREVLSSIFKDEGYTVFCSEDGDSGLSLLKTEPIDVVFLDIWLPNRNGLEVLVDLKKIYPVIQVILISGHANIETAVQGIKLGAYDFIEKPIDLDKVLTVLGNALKLINLTKENLQLKKKIGLVPHLVGHSNEIEDVKKRATIAGSSNATCLITGENGTGKELIAQLIHYNSDRRDKSFIELNCAAIPDNLLESELFGHEKGSFTGAFTKKIGQFELANNGTLFLDELGDLSLSAQAKLLRAIQEQRFMRVGGTDEINVNIRIIAATNKDLQKAIKDGDFREDLYFRLNVIPINIPPLRERTEDITDLLNYFCDMFTLDNQKRQFDLDALNYLSSYGWAGNIRQLKNFCERLCVLCQSTVFSIDDVKNYLDNDLSVVSGSSVNYNDYLGMRLNDAKESFERFIIEESIKKHKSVALAAEKLGLYPSNLHAKIKKYGIVLK